jgi:glycosyltransferase involved in cell wall biosynthesis
MKVIYIDQTGQLGGGELSLLDWLAAVREKNHVILFEDGPFRERLEAVGESVEVIPVGGILSIRRGASPLSLAKALPAAWNLRRRLRQALGGADVLYANSQKAFQLAAISAHKAQPLIWHLRDLLTPEHFSPVLIRMAILAANRYAALILVNSRATGEAFVVAGGRRDKVRLVPDGIDPAPFDAVDREESARIRNELAPAESFVIGLFGRLAHWKGQHVLLEACSKLPDVHVCLVGDALFGETDYAEQLRRRAADPDLAGRVHFLGFRKDVPELMTAMDLIVHTSVSAEPLGRVIIEAMMARKPVIATRAGGAAEIVEEGISGLMVVPDSVEELCTAIARMQKDAPLRARLAANGRIRAESAYSLSMMVEATQKAIEEVGTGVP